LADNSDSSPDQSPTSEKGEEPDSLSDVEDYEIHVADLIAEAGFVDVKGYWDPGGFISVIESEPSPLKPFDGSPLEYSPLSEAPPSRADRDQY
jgi:hypothetical protein